MSRWVKVTVLDDTTHHTAEIELPDKDVLTLDRALAERLLFEAGYEPVEDRGLTAGDAS